MERAREETERQRVARELRDPATEKERGWRNSPDATERALDVEPAEPGVERHAGEDPGVAPDPEREEP